MFADVEHDLHVEEDDDCLEEWATVFLDNNAHELGVLIAEQWTQQEEAHTDQCQVQSWRAVATMQTLGLDESNQYVQQ